MPRSRLKSSLDETYLDSVIADVGDVEVHTENVDGKTIIIPMFPKVVHKPKWWPTGSFETDPVDYGTHLVWRIIQTFTWVRAYGGSSYDSMNDLVGDGSDYVVLGLTYSFGSTVGDPIVFKVDKHGDVVWGKRYVSSDVMRPDKLSNFGGTYMAYGVLTKIGEDRTYGLIMSIGSDGGINWAKTYIGYGTTTFNTMLKLQDGKYLVGGESDALISTGSGHVFVSGPTIMKLDTDGSLSLAKLYMTNSRSLHRIIDIGSGLLLATSGGVTVNPMNVALIQTDYDGNVEWAKTYTPDEGTLVESDTMKVSDGYIFLGYKAVGTNPVVYYIVLAKINSDGSIAWAKQYSNVGYATSLSDMGDGYVLFAFDGADVVVIKTDYNGNVEWAKKYGGSDYNILLGQVQLENKHLIMRKIRKSNESYYKPLMMLIDGDGNVEWAKTYGLVSSDQNGGLVVDSGALLGVNTRSYGAGGNDIMLIKVNSEGDTKASVIVVEDVTSTLPVTDITNDVTVSDINIQVADLNPDVYDLTSYITVGDVSLSVEDITNDIVVTDL